MLRVDFKRCDRSKIYKNSFPSTLKYGVRKNKQVIGKIYEICSLACNKCFNIQIDAL